ncbi:6-phosphogluconolactonase [Allochromatium warmingii]|uniref:6-phosphogluconolactonase n=1 Tax=Allochromatium warmingii TaxID=61595 RepID=A0A1H3GXA2_ALLWA|nr:6-phosphogluconolactonase [Allochromatium warmingii]SDY07953.1 6-phosphogluconolactonase [Allochromatium warmingii]
MTATHLAFQQFASAEQVAEAATQRILTAATHAIATRGRFQIVLAGGRTPLAVYQRLATHAADWAHWHIFFGDERCVPVPDAARNSVAAQRVWLDQVPIPPQQMHPIPAELGAMPAAARYAELISERLPFDLVLLGLGEDGHTGSLFPGHAIPDAALVMPVTNAPKPPAERVSLTPMALGASAYLLILVTGRDKREALQRWRAGAALPIARLVSAGRIEVLVDAEAAGA